MLTRISVTFAFFGHLVRDLVGTLRGRWQRFVARTVEGRETATVAVDIFPFFERMTGVGWYEWNLLAALDERDDGLVYNLYGHSFLAPDESAPPEMPGERRMRLRVHHIPAGFLLPVGATIRLLRATIEPLLRVLDGNDVLFAPNFFVPARQLPFGRTVVATVHDLAFARMPETVAEATLAELRANLPLSRFRAERLIAVSDATASDLVEALGASRRRIHTVHSGLDPEFAATGGDLGTLRPPERYLLFVSTLEPRKNVVGAIRAFELTAEWGYAGELLLVGRWGWREGPIRDAIATSSYRDRIRHLDYLPRAALPPLYRGADAVLFPSWLEGFGFPVLEAMACGAPVVTSGRSSLPEVGGAAAIYADPESPHSIASAVASLLADDDNRRRLADAGRSRASRFRWSDSAAATAQVLRQAAGLTATDADEHRV